MRWRLYSRDCCQKTCDKVICKPGYSKKPKASGIKCDGDCTPGDCCQKTCDKVICKPGYSKKPKASDITCDGDCTPGDCCQKTCDKVICKPGYSKKPKASGIKCDGDCTSGDCCKQNKPVMKLLVPVSSKKNLKRVVQYAMEIVLVRIVVHQRQTLVRRLHVPLDSLQKRVRRIRKCHNKDCTSQCCRKMDM